MGGGTIFRQLLWGDTAVMRGDKELMGDPQSPPIGKTLMSTVFIQRTKENLIQEKHSSFFNQSEWLHVHKDFRHTKPYSGISLLD